MRFRDPRAFSWVLFKAGSQLKVLQYKSTEAQNLHLKGLDNKEHELFVLHVTTSIKWIFYVYVFRSIAHEGKIRQQTLPT